MFNKQNISRNTCQLTGAQARKGYDWWWHSFTGYYSTAVLEAEMRIKNRH